MKWNEVKEFLEKRGHEVDVPCFCAGAPGMARRGVYFILWRHDLQYIGSSRDVIKRWYQHKRFKKDTVYFIHFPGRIKDAEEKRMKNVEYWLISHLKPPENRDSWKNR